MKVPPAVSPLGVVPAPGGDGEPAGLDGAAARRIPGRGRHGERDRLERLEWLRGQARAELRAFETTRIDAARLRGNVENLVGAVEVPVGVAGPLLFRGEHARGWCYAPLATTEGALVSSVVRGALALSRSGGVLVRVHGQRMTRTPVFVLGGLDESVRFAAWLGGQLPAMREEVAAGSRHARLVEVIPTCIGSAVFARFVYETGDAAGQNMTTAATWRACEWLLARAPEEAGVRVLEFVIEGNLSGDKKVTVGSLAWGRGLRVSASALVPRGVLKRVLDTTPEQLARLNQLGMLGSIQAGSVGYTVNVANVVAAIFVATGQDLACVHESSVGLLDLGVEGEDLRANLLLPSLAVGTVGGGTHLPGQRAALEMLGCTGEGGVRRLGELIAGFCLALELSTSSAVVSGAFAAAHERLGRNRQAFDPLRREELDAAFFEGALRTAEGDGELAVRGAAWGPLEGGTAILSSLGADAGARLLGLHRVRLRVRRGGGESDLPLVVKSKPRDTELLQTLGRMALACGRAMSTAWKEHGHATPFAGSHLRELAVYAQTDPRFLRNVPRVYGTLRDDAREAYVIVMEDLSDAPLLDAVDDPAVWTAARLHATIRGLAELHSVWLGRERELAAQPWLGAPPSARRMARMASLWIALAEHAAGEDPGLMTRAALARQRQLIATIEEWWPRLERMPRTLVHDDFNPRNLALRVGADGEHRLAAFDWELATLHVPQYDLVELLAHTLTPEATGDEVWDLVEQHRGALCAASGSPLDPAAWREGFRLALRDFTVNRLAFLFVASAFRESPFLPRVFQTTARLRELVDDG
ncbi:MAG TPA: hypothetical protein VLT61_11330 [Anaeromyxobacteraceae bacterium]|nr:hypothetical protein [Anaeromyxobacteraceae bacterium]